MEGFRVTECREATGDPTTMILALARTRAILSDSVDRTIGNL
jgi:hypothetical protein